MSIKANVPFLLSLVLLVILWKETQGRCSSCPSNDCLQTEMSQGKCFRARYYTTTDVVSYYTTVYYQETSQGSYRSKCGFFGWRRCTRYRIIYHQRSKSVLKTFTIERENLACDVVPCPAGKVTVNPTTPGGVNPTTASAKPNPPSYSDGSIRLVGGTTTREGRVEIWYNRQWNTICDDLWDINDAHVVCRQLGYEGAVTAHQSAHFGEGSGQILLDDLRCTGREASLFECSHNGINNHNCSHSDDASVTCTISSFTSGTLRLTNGYAPSVGRVEVWYSDQWNTVCDDSWSITDARVACRQLGYQGAAIAHQNAHFGEGSGRIILDNLDCTGAETSLLQCRHNGLYSHNCDHDQDAGVTCGCGDPGISFGIIPTLSGTAVGDTMTFTCQSGYILSGSSTRTCLPNGSWSDDVPRCLRSCGTPRSLPNGQTSYTSTIVGSKVNYTCNPGYGRTAGNSSGTCQSNGQWSESHPTCTRLKPPSQVTGVALSKNLRRGRPSLIVSWTAPQSDAPISQYRIQYKRTGAVFWGSEAATAGPPFPTSVTLISLAVATNYIVRVRATSPAGEGIWSEEQTERTYRYPSRVTHVYLTLFEATSLNVTWAIPQSDMPITQYQVQYRSDEAPSWSSAPPLSGSPPPSSTVLNGMHSGFVYILRVRAMSDVGAGEWSEEQTQRIGSVCDEPDSPMNGGRVTTGNTEGDTARYFCNSGFQLTGNTMRTCQSDGQWSGSQPKCTPSCGHPDFIANGVRRYFGTTEGSTVNYTCNPGYKMFGGSRRICQSNGQWSGSQPSCEILNCVEIPNPKNGHVIIESTRYHGIARYACNTGYELSGQEVRKCQGNGQWSGIPPQCTDINECEAWTNVCNPEREHCLNREGGFDCECNPGFILSGDKNCIDLNECESGQHSCNGYTSICLNTVGSYKCHCLSGFEDSINSYKERICKDIDECKTTQVGNCEHRCGNILGSYQCHCNEGYSLQQGKCKRDNPPCVAEQLPVPGNSSISCEKIEDGLKCKITCYPMFTFGSSEDFSPQYCRNGIWDYQRDKLEFPDCQPIKKSNLLITGWVESNETCRPRQEYRKRFGSNVPIPAYIDFQCRQSGSRHIRSATDEGTLIVTFTFSEEIPFNCDFECLDRISWTLRFQFYEIQWRVATGLTLSVVNLETSEQVNVTLMGELQAESELQISCALGQILSQDQGFCIPCAPGSFFNKSGLTPRCDPCPFHHYQDESEQTECRACPNETFTIARGSNDIQDCRAPCSPGTASWSGLVPCEECKKGFYQPESGANFCHKCDFGQMTHTSGSPRKEDCGCPAGSFWNDCLEKCPCANGGICELDGSCICPQGLTGPNCTQKDLYHALLDSYLVSFLENIDNTQMRHIFALTGVTNSSVSITVKRDDSQSQVSHYHLSSYNFLDLQLSPTMQTVVHISASQAVSIFGEVNGGGTFAALPISPLLGDPEFEEYLVMSHANNIVETNFVGFIVIVASTDNTEVKVTSGQNTSSFEEELSGEEYEEAVIFLHRLDTLTLTSYNDLTGTVIKADKPIAVYSGHECGNVPVHISNCRHLIEQMPPVRVLGYCYIVTSFMGRQDGSYVKFVAAVDVTYVEAYENDTIVVTYGPLYQGMFHERYLDPGRVLVLKSSQPIMVAQFSPGTQLDDIGAPFMIVLHSLSQLVSEVPFYSKNSSDVNYFHYITITVPSQYYDEDAINLDGEPIHSNATTTVQSPLCGNFTLVSLEVASGLHYLQHTTPGAGFLLSVYGFAPGTSYGYSPGLNQVLSRDGASSSMEDHQE